MNEKPEKGDTSPEAVELRERRGEPALPVPEPSAEETVAERTGIPIIPIWRWK